MLLQLRTLGNRSYGTFCNKIALKFSRLYSRILQNWPITVCVLTKKHNKVKYFSFLSSGPTDVLPSIISGPSNQSVDERTNVVFSCEVDGSPEPSVSWFQNDDNVPLQNTSSVLITQSGLFSQLSITNVNISDKGMYRCVATSNIGTGSQDAQLVVKSKFSYMYVGVINL